MYCKVVFDVPLDRDFDYLVPEELASQIKPGLRVTAPFGPRLTGGLVTAVSEISTAPAHISLKPITSLVDTYPLFGSDLFALARFIKNYWGGPIGQILFALVPPQPYFKLLPASTPVPVQLASNPFTFSAEQKKAWHALQQVPPYQFSSLLLSGPAGTGKTEVVLHQAAHVLEQGGQALIMVPDIVAAGQFMRRAQARLAEAHVFGWHSRTLQSQKKAYFSAISAGQPCVVVATRSGVLLPFKNLRLAAMLAEGDENYKQEENKPYYHAREVLAWRAQRHGATLVFVSSVPSMELLSQARQGTLQTFPFTRPVGAVPPRFTLQLTAKKSDKSRVFSAELLEALAQNLQQKKTSLLILNRRGYANAYYCLNCGAYAKCKACGALLTHEKTDKQGEHLHCKKCGHIETLEQECPKCHNLIFKSRGGGTQKIVTELSKFFPQARILRLDSDSLQTKNGQGFAALRALQEGNADMIVSTRLVSGALGSSNVSLAVILDAELELDGPDFRASEKYTRLLFELRGHLALQPKGTLLVQTADSTVYDYTALQQGNYEQLVQTELTLRESFGYPPFTRLIRVTVKAKDTDILQTQTARVQQIGSGRALEVLGPVWCTKKTDKLKKQYLLFKTDEARYLDLLAQLDSFEPAKGCAVQVSADPYNFY